MLLSCCEFMMEAMEEIFQYFVRNAYIIVAKDGTSFYDSGKKAFHLITRNLLDCIVLNRIGDFVLVLMKVFVTAFSGCVAYAIVTVSRNVVTDFC